MESEERDSLIALPLTQHEEQEPHDLQLTPLKSKANQTVIVPFRDLKVCPLDDENLETKLEWSKL